MKTIIVRWVEEEEFGYGKVMQVLESDHKRFSNGTMSEKQLFTRLYKITDRQKLENFIRCCSMDFPIYYEIGLGQAARERYRNLFKEFAPVPEVPSAPVKFIPRYSFPLDPSNKKELRATSTVGKQEPIKPKDFIDILPKRKLRLD